MSGLWKKNPETPEGKYPIVLRRDGTVLTAPYVVMTLRDPCAAAALRAYANEAVRQGLDEQYIADFYELDEQAVVEARNPGDPDAPRHRTDDPRIIAWARQVHGLDGASA